MARAERFNSDAALAASGTERQIASLREQKGLLEEQARWRWCCAALSWFYVVLLWAICLLLLLLIYLACHGRARLDGPSCWTMQLCCWAAPAVCSLRALPCLDPLVLQVATLQRQVEGLVARRESQEGEVAALRMALAAQHDENAAGSEAQKVRLGWDWCCAKEISSSAVGVAP